jgi:uncharacterized protein (DUF2336 family)
VQQPVTSLFDDLDAALRSGCADKRLDMLRSITALFLADANRLNEEQIAVFDDVLGHLIEKIEACALAEISAKFATLSRTPVGVTASLASHTDTTVARPVLVNSASLTTTRLVEIAKTMGQGHLLAISERQTLAPAVTDVLVERGNKYVLRSVAGNAGAQFSERGFAGLVKASEGDETLAEKTSLRADLPKHLLRDLLSKATEAVRARLLSLLPPELKEDVLRALTAATKTLAQETGRPRNFQGAKALVDVMRDKGQLDEARIVKFARAGHLEEVVAALASLASTSIEIIKPLMQSTRDEGLLIPCKVAGFDWSTVSEVIELKSPMNPVQRSERSKLREEYEKLAKPNAQRILRFWQVREVSTKDS